MLCQQARRIQRYAEEYNIIHKPVSMKIPKREVTYTEKGNIIRIRPMNDIPYTNNLQKVSWKNFNIMRML